MIAALAPLLGEIGAAAGAAGAARLGAAAGGIGEAIGSSIGRHAAVSGAQWAHDKVTNSE